MKLVVAEWLRQIGYIWWLVDHGSPPSAVLEELSHDSPNLSQREVRSRVSTAGSSTQSTNEFITDTQPLTRSNLERFRKVDPALSHSRASEATTFNSRGDAGELGRARNIIPWNQSFQVFSGGLLQAYQ